MQYLRAYKMVKTPNNAEEPTVTCEICNKDFKEKHKLKRHMMIHTGEKPHTCSICGKSFSLEYNLNPHVRVHTGEKPFICQIPGCEKSFTQSGNLKTHMKTNHSQRIEDEIVLKKEETPKNFVNSLSFESVMIRALSDFSKSLG